MIKYYEIYWINARISNSCISRVTNLERALLSIDEMGGLVVHVKVVLK